MRAWMKPETRRRLLRIKEMAAAGASKREVALDLCIDVYRVSELLSAWVGSADWPPNIPQMVFDVPVQVDERNRPVAYSQRAVERVAPMRDGFVEKAEPRDPCGFCGVRQDKHDEFGCKRWRALR